MSELAAVRAAIDLIQVPQRIRPARASPLPDGIDVVLRIAAGEAETIAACLEPTGRSAEFLREASTFYIEQVLLAPGTDSFRALGCNPDTEPASIRRNMAFLLRWLHPDVAGGDGRDVFASRITAAWETVKTSERRAGYTHALIAASPSDDAIARSRGRSGRPRRARMPDPGLANPSRLRLILDRLLGRTL